MFMFIPANVFLLTQVFDAREHIITEDLLGFRVREFEKPNRTFAVVEKAPDAWTLPEAPDLRNCTLNSGLTPEKIEELSMASTHSEWWHRWPNLNALVVTNLDCEPSLRFGLGDFPGRISFHKVCDM